MKHFLHPCGNRYTPIGRSLINFYANIFETLYGLVTSRRSKIPLDILIYENEKYFKLNVMKKILI